MLDHILQYYGLDWAALVFGLTGCHLITTGRQEGFIFSAISALCGVFVASVSGQYGYIVYNLILTAMFSRSLVRQSSKSCDAFEIKS